MSKLAWVTVQGDVVSDLRLYGKGYDVKITICGSLRYEKQVQEWHEKLALAGHTVYSMVVLPSQKAGVKDWYTDDEKETLDLLHLSKIEESDGVFVVDVDGYIGPSTRREIKWARMRNKDVYFASENAFCVFNLNLLEPQQERM